MKQLCLWTAALFLLLGVSAQAVQVSVEGVVLRPDGQVLAGARVELRPVLRVYEQSLREQEGLGEPEPVARGRTGSDGWYRLVVPAEGAWRVTVSAAGFVPMDSGALMLSGEALLKDLQMDEDVGISIRVEDADGRPLAGARVAAVGAPASAWRPCLRLGVTGPGGILRLPRMADEALRLSAIATGHAIGRAAVTGGQAAVLRLERGRAMTFEIFDGGKPVPDAVIRDQESALLIGRTGADGRLFADAPARSTWGLQVEARDGRLAPYRIQPVPAKVRADARVRRRLLLPAVVALAGRVIDQESNRPVPGALVWPEDDPAAFQRADSRGEYRLAAWAENVQILLSAKAEGYVNSFESFTPAGTRSAPPTLALQPSASLEGIVVDPDGQPVAEAEVRISNVSCRTSSLGRFRFPHLPPNRGYEVMASHPGFAPALVGVQLGENRSELRLELGWSRAASGRIVDADGAPVADAQVELTRNEASRLLLTRSTDDGPYRAATGEDGRFEIEGLPEGWFDLKVVRQGFISLSREGLEIEDAGALTELGTFALERGGTLEGRVTRPDGKPAAGVPIRVEPIDHHEVIELAGRWRLESAQEAVTDSDGRFALRGLYFLFGFTLHFCLPDRQTLSIRRDRLPEEPLEITLPVSPSGRLAGRVTGPDGRPVEGAAVSAEADGEDPPSSCPQDGSGQALTDAEGQFVLDRLGPGEHVLLAEAEGYAPADPVVVEIRPGESEEGLSLQLQRGATLSGSVFAADGAPAAGAEVQFDRDQRATADGDGHYEFRAAKPGRRHVSAWHPTRGSGSVDIAVLPGDNHLDLTLDAPKKQAVRGRVVGPDGEPVEGAGITDLFGFVSVFTDADGSFAMEDDSPFKLGILCVRKAGFAPARFNYTYTPDGGDVEGLELHLKQAVSLSGRILGAQPEDLTGVTILASTPGQDSRYALVYEDGTYRILSLEAGEWEVDAYLGDREAHFRIVIAPGESHAELDLALP